MWTSGRRNWNAVTPNFHAIILFGRRWLFPVQRFWSKLHALSYISEIVRFRNRSNKKISPLSLFIFLTTKVCLNRNYKRKKWKKKKIYFQHLNQSTLIQLNCNIASLVRQDYPCFLEWIQRGSFETVKSTINAQVASNQQQLKRSTTDFRAAPIFSRNEREWRSTSVILSRGWSPHGELAFVRESDLSDRENGEASDWRHVVPINFIETVSFCQARRPLNVIRLSTRVRIHINLQVHDFYTIETIRLNWIKKLKQIYYPFFRV